jgi:transketolase
MVYTAGEGHIPSSFSIVDIIETLYRNVLKFDSKNPESSDRDFFVLSKGHGAAALFAVLHKHGFLTDNAMRTYGTPSGILGGHPDSRKVPGAEFSTGSLGHGLPMAVGVALGLKIRGQGNQVFVLVGDGECHEGTIWEAANVAANNLLDNLTVIVDWNGSASQLMPLDNLPAKWRAFGWETIVVNGHVPSEIEAASSARRLQGVPRAIVAETTKGFGVDFLEGHGAWHHKVPSKVELGTIRETLERLGD